MGLKLGAIKAIPRKNNIIGIIGNGALGHGVQELLRQKGVPSQLLGRSQRFTVSPKIVFFAVKSYQLESALLEHLPLLPNETIVILIGNGWVLDKVTPIQKKFPNLIVRMGSSTIGSTKTERGFEIRANGKIVWGALDETPCSLDEKELLGKISFLEWSDAIQPVVRKKWLFNCSLNTICGAFDLKTNAESLQFLGDMQLLFDEAFQLGEKKWGAWSAPREKYWSELRELIESTRQNENSMAQDVRLRVKTEVDFLTGVAAGENCPAMNRFTKILKDKERHATKGI